MAKKQQADEVRNYYDKNTRRFLAHGEGGDELAIRRSVWAPGITERSEAMQYVNSRILEEVRKTGAERVVDLGCGVGGSIIYLARRHPAEYTGVTLSSVQGEFGNHAIAKEGISNSRLTVGDFSDPTFWNSLKGEIDLAFAIEAMVHVEDASSVLEGASRRLKPGGRFVIMDDFLAERKPSGRREKRWLKEFRDGWRAAGLRRVSNLVELAASKGFHLLEEDDFTPYLELDRPRDIAARLFIALFRWWPGRGPWFSNLYGGNALQLCEKHNLIQYRYLVFSYDPERTA